VPNLTGQFSYWDVIGVPNVKRLAIKSETAPHSHHCWWFTPLFNFENGKTYIVQYFARYNASPSGGPGNIQVFRGLCDSIQCMTIGIGGTTFTTSVPITISYTFTVSVTNNYRIGIKFFGQNDGDVIDIDDILIQEEIPFPVTISALTATPIGGNAQLNWTTYTEYNNRGFGIEQSRDGQLYNQIQFISSRATNGQSVLPLTYKVPVSTGFFYRLKQTDFNGKFTYSNIVKVGIAGVGGLLLQPIGQRLQIKHTATNGFTGQVKVYNANGQLQSTVSKTFTNGLNQFDLDIGGLAAGLYYLQVSSGSNHTITKAKFLKQ